MRQLLLPLRDLFTILFFVYLGASVNLPTVIAKLPLILLFTSIVILIKCVLIICIFIRFKFHSRTSFSIAILLSQVGEFAFILLNQAFVLRVISEESYHFAVASVLLTIAVTPILVTNMEKIYITSKRFIKKKLPDMEGFLQSHVDREPAHIDALSLKDHVVICGFGRVGRYIGRALDMAKISYIAIDYNLHVVETARKEGVNIIYGDPTDIDILDYAQAETATCLISAVPDTFSQEMIVLNSKKLNQKIVIFSRVNQEKNQERLKDLGAHIIIQPEFEASLAIVRKIFTVFNIPREDTIGKIKRLRIEHGMG
jgi:CPA2 family monovalent cation:H+ antiporter-2